MKTTPYRILLIDDHPVVRRGLAELIACEIDCLCEEAANRKECLAALETGDFDLAILDISLGQESGFDLIELLSELGTGIVVYSMFEDKETIYRALAEGCLGYVSKREPAEELIAGIKQALKARMFLSTLAAHAVGSAEAGGSIDPENTLSRREFEALDLLGLGYGRQEIANTMAISVRTADTYCLRIAGKLNLPSIRELRRFAIDRQRRVSGKAP